MKKSLLLSVLLSMAISNGFGQSKKNDLKFTVAALPLFGSSDTFESGSNGFVIKPSIGYLISDKTSIDVNFTYATLNDLKVDNVDSHYHSYAFVPTLRNIFVNKNNVRFFAEIGFGLGTIKYNADNHALQSWQHNDLSGGISILNIGFGGNYFFNEHFACTRASFSEFAFPLTSIAVLPAREAMFSKKVAFCLHGNALFIKGIA